MARQIITQPDGKFCVFSTIIDDFILTDATKEEVEQMHSEEAAEKAVREVNIIFDKIKAGALPYYQFTLSYEEAVLLANKTHSK